MSVRHLRLFTVAMAACATVAACGSNTPEIPEKYLQATGNGGGADDYPDGPYGDAEGDTIENFKFSGWINPVAAGFDESKLEVIEFADFYAPAGTIDRNGETLPVEILMINTSAGWCQACKVEHKDLPIRFEELAPKGLQIISLIFQNSRSEPAVFSDLQVWTESFDSPFPFALDPEFQMGRYASAETAPLNMIVDARNMKVIRKFIGDQSAEIWPLIEGELEKRASK